MNHARYRSKTRERLLAQMHAVYGRREGKFCGECAHFGPQSYRDASSSCALAKGPHWLARFPACGKFEKVKT